MQTPGARVIAAVGVLGSLASVVALFVSPGGRSEPRPDPTPLVVNLRDASQPAVPAEPAGPEPLRLPPISDLLFSEARELLLRQGWFPISSPANPTGNPNLMSGNGPYFVEKGYREVVNCSGSGLAPCEFAYRSEAGQKLIVVTVGEDAHARVNDLWIDDNPE